MRPLTNGSKGYLIVRVAPRAAFRGRDPRSGPCHATGEADVRVQDVVPVGVVGIDLVAPDAGDLKPDGLVAEAGIACCLPTGWFIPCVQFFPPLVVR